MSDPEVGVPADHDDATDPGGHTEPQRLCTVRRRSLAPGGPPSRCDQPEGHWPATAHRWVDVKVETTRSNLL